jgi:hypothetical protein
MKTFRLPVTWEMYGVVEVEAESLEEAIWLAENPDSDVELPAIRDYINESFKVQRDMLKTMPWLNER